jgi:hypothetical protein
VSFAVASASASVSNGRIATIGPKISSRAMRHVGVASAKTVGGMYAPFERTSSV